MQLFAKIWEFTKNYPWIAPIIVTIISTFILPLIKYIYTAIQSKHDRIVRLEITFFSQKAKDYTDWGFKYVYFKGIVVIGLSLLIGSIIKSNQEIETFISAYLMLLVVIVVWERGYKKKGANKYKNYKLILVNY